MENRCGCCAGTEVATPKETANRPGLSALAYRVGTHAAFLETMKARLSNLALEIPIFDEHGQPDKNRIYPLQDLKTRDASDPAIALLDAWAIVGDVLTFYQERIANEGYLRTATERHSILELARLIGYRPRPGVASSVYLAYTLDDKSEPVEIPAGARAQSIPGPGELPQSFETSAPLAARKEWNDLKPRTTQPQRITLDNALAIERIYFEGTAINLKANDLLMLVFGDDEQKVLRKVQESNANFDKGYTEVVLQKVSVMVRAILFSVNKAISSIKAKTASQPLPPQGDKQAAGLSEVFQNIRQNILLGSSLQPLLMRSDKTELLAQLERRMLLRPVTRGDDLVPELDTIIQEFEDELTALPPDEIKRRPVVGKLTNLSKLIAPLLKSLSQQPANSQHLIRSVRQSFNSRSDIVPQMLVKFNPALEGALYPAWANANVKPGSSELKDVYAFRVNAPLFGYNAPVKMALKKTGDNDLPFISQPDGDQSPSEQNDEAANQIFLDSIHDSILPQSHLVIQKNPGELVLIDRHLTIAKVNSVLVGPRTAYGFSGKTTRLVLSGETGLNPKNESMDTIRRTIVYAQSELLKLAEEPITDALQGDTIELDALYDGLDSGRCVIVSGERIDVTGTSGMRGIEPVILAGVKQSFRRKRPGDKVHTTLILANKLAYKYKRDTVIIYGNVVKATHGETRNEVLGGGDATQAMQQFTLKQPPLTYVSAPTIEGIASTLHVYINDVEWHETDSLAGLAPGDRKFITLTDDDAKTTVVFGNGREGARLPTGAENVRAVYRNGIGKGGNVKAEQISLLTTRPLGVKEVINPLRASGGADKESRDQARRNAPLAVMSLDRLVSTQDYADFARTFAGIGKASAARLSDGHRRLVHLTIAGTDDIPIDERSDLYLNLRQALSQFGDPFQVIQVDVRELVALVISANVRVLPDYQWEKVEPKIRAALLSGFSFDERELGQPVFLSEVISTVQHVAGVAFVDVDVLDSVSESVVVNQKKLEEKFNPAVEETAISTNVPPDTSKALIEQPRKYISVELAETAATAKAKGRVALTTGKSILPAQLAILLPAVPDTLILNLVKEVKQ
jgi:hypothetical protein